MYFQLSDAEKDDVPEHVKKAAREMNRKAFEERLKEIKMSDFDAKLYEQFYRAVQPQVTYIYGVNHIHWPRSSVAQAKLYLLM